jgi:hypothetical protein
MYYISLNGQNLLTQASWERRRAGSRDLSALQGGLVPNKISGVGTNFGLLVHVLPDRGIVIVLRPAPVIYYAQSPLGSLLGSELISILTPT